MTRKVLLGGAAVLAAIGIGAFVVHQHEQQQPSGGSGGSAPPQLGSGAQTGYDVSKWHVVAVTSPYGQSVLSGQQPVGSFNASDYVTFVLAYDGAHDPKIDPTLVAVGQIGAIGQPTATGKTTAAIRFIKEIQWNSNYSPSIPAPPPDTMFSVSTDDVAKVLTPDETQQLLGTA